jgi:2-dehydropantoate 2-reductase
MPGVMWGKLLVNLNNAINALSGVSLADELRQRDFRRAWALSIEEGLKLVQAAGIEPVDPLPMPLKLMPQIMRLPDALYRYVVAAGSGGKVRVDPHARSSMADDLARGRPTEVDFLQGEVVRLAERLGRKAPVNARLVELVRAAEASAKPWTAAALCRDLHAQA